MRKLSSKEKTQIEQQILFNKIMRSLHSSPTIKKYGIEKVVWAMNRFVNKQRNLKKLHKKEKDSVGSN